MTKEEFLNNLKELKVFVTDEMLEKLEIYKNFLQEYNNHTNITRIIENNDIYLKHFYDSLAIVKAIDLNNVDSLLDVGTGAGFPGMVLKIFFPKLKVTLLDSNNKKTKFLEELKTKLNLDVEIVNVRVEDYARENLNKYSVVTSRAVANLRVLAEISLPLVKKDGYFIPLKGNIENELKEAKSTINYFDSKIIKKCEFNLYQNELFRTILVIQKNKETEINILRPYNKILRKPLA